LILLYDLLFQLDPQLERRFYTQNRIAAFKFVRAFRLEETP